MVRANKYASSGGPSAANGGGANGRKRPASPVAMAAGTTSSAQQQQQQQQQRGRGATNRPAVPNSQQRPLANGALASADNSSGNKRRKQRRASFKPNGAAASAGGSGGLFRGRLPLMGGGGPRGGGGGGPPRSPPPRGSNSNARKPALVSPTRPASRRRSGMLLSSATKRRALGASVAAGINPGAVIVEEEEVGGAATAAANIRVAVRVRPESERELQMGMRNVIEIVDDRMLIFDPKDSGDDFFFKGKLQGRRDVNKREQRDHKFAFDVVFGPQATNQEVFDRTTRDLVEVLFSGYNCSVFVYGSTGAGKTFTMLGSPDNPGLTYRTVLELYQRLEAASAEVSCEVAVSYLEVYNETCIDLIVPGAQLAIREDGNSGVQIPGLSLHKPEGPEHLLQILQRGNQNRTQHPTDANAESSRSHAVFQVYLKQRSRSQDLSTDVKVAKLSMIDLAGSERGTVAMARGATRLREGANINKSLLALGNCINALADGSKYVPFRDSKLTRLLKDSIGGNCRTVMISNVTPNAIQFEDTYNTLKYADRAKRIRIKLKKNVLNVDFHIGQYAKAVESLRSEIAALKSKIVVLEEENKDLKEKQQASQQSPEAVVSAPDLDQTFEVDKEGGAKEEEEEESAVVRDLRDQLRQSEERQKDFDAMRQRVEHLEQLRAATDNGAPMPSDVLRLLLEPVELHKVLLKRLGDDRAHKKKLELKAQFVAKILERSRLVALGDGGAANDKIVRHEAMLQKKLRKAEAKERATAGLLAESQVAVDSALMRGDAGGEWPVRCLRAELESLSLRNRSEHLLDVLRLVSQEQGRVETMLQQCLPMLKDKHLLLSSYDPDYAAKSHDQFMELIACVQCTKIQFNDCPDVKNFNKDSPFQLNLEDRTAGVAAAAAGGNKSGRRLSTCGLGPLADIVSETISSSPMADVEEEEEEIEVDETVDATLEVHDHPYSSPAPSKQQQQQHRVPLGDSTFTMEEEEDAQGNSTFVLEEPGDVLKDSLANMEDDEEEVMSSPKFSQYRPATPPKKQHQLLLPARDKENESAASSSAAAVTPRNSQKNILYSSSSSATKAPLKPNNNSFYAATTK